MIINQGIFDYELISSEYSNKRIGRVKVIIVKNMAKVVYDEKGSLNAEIGEILFEGLIIRHKSGKWILTYDKKDKNAEEIGGCTEIPILDPKTKTIEWC